MPFISDKGLSVLWKGCEMGMKEAIIQYNDNPDAGGIQMVISWKPLVRCKDCKYNDDGECIIKAGWFPVKPDWFCADGERRSE